MKKIVVVNGPNLNLLGLREPSLYGEVNLQELNEHLMKVAKERDLELVCLQSNIEGELINFLQGLKGGCDCLIMNAGAYTHTSIALRDTLLAIKLPFIEVHISNIDKREEYRKVSYLSDLAEGVISGFGVFGYELAILAAEKVISSSLQET